MAYKRSRAFSPSASQKRYRGGSKHVAKVSLGTELPGEDERDDGAFVPEWKQIVTDDRGRRRLHGAFTGGFSAGYYNTVGSKEGWTPSTFVSSRKNRNKDRTDASAPTQRPEDFMDEEDLAEAAESRQLEMAQTFAGIGRAGESTTDAFFGLFAGQEETAGVKIAQKLGWRQSQGVGSKIRRLAYEDEGSSDASAAHMFAPKDSRAVSSDHKETLRKGLGYQSEARLGKKEESKDDSRPLLALPFFENDGKEKAPKKAAPKKSSFGVGVLNDTGSDDEDPYELGPKISFNRTIGKEKKAKKPSKFAKTTIRPAIVPRGVKKRLDKPTLRGFVEAEQFQNFSVKLRYPPPQIPPGWVSSKASSKSTEPQRFQSVADAAKNSTLDATSRAKILGETALPGRSVFDFIKPEVRDRLAKMTGRTDLPAGRGMSAPEGFQSAEKAQPNNLWTFVPVLEKDIAAAALRGFMPYSDDPKKRDRYVGFLELRAGKKSDLPERPANMPISDWAQELAEFVQAARVFKPSTGKMASRFVSSTSSFVSGNGASASGENLVRQAVAIPEDPAELSAKAGMYGPMTRSTFPFYPSRLVCKRFGVTPPSDAPPGDDDVDYGAFSKAEEAISKTTMQDIQHDFLTHGSVLQRPSWVASDAPNSMPSMATEPKDKPVAVNPESNDTFVKERQSDTVFSSIFDDDDDNDE
ncbi:G patch domain-containing protein 1 [Corynespora cassiicola Philippines]|uniref:G patch domain-containing protein 1 n=1 Tax=Corynespora cassiicola Philippines TaxID=1448308 RepID=A0A2T2P6K7_CORCC|nr:G patch domain-containing protein 1 [Corynespora cassiicola Philippines]